MFLTLAVQVAQITAYFMLLCIVIRTTKGARIFEDLILHETVPELVYLQTRKLLREEHVKRNEERRTAMGNSYSVSFVASPSELKEEEKDEI